MSDDRIHDVLSGGVPLPPAPTGWAMKAARRSSARRAAIGVAAVLTVVAIPTALLVNGERPLVATPVSPSPSAPTTPATASPSTPADALPLRPGEVVGVVDIFQTAEEELPHLCFGIVMSSQPPQCPGPTLVGDFSWDDIPHGEYGGVRWTEKSYQVIGFLDLAAGEHGTFTLTRPILQKDRDYPDSPPLDLPNLCVDDSFQDLTEGIRDRDPHKGADPGKTDNEAQHAFERVLGELPIVDVWSNGGEDDYGFSVLVQGNPDEAWRTIREVWGGWLCVGSSDEPTEKERQAAFERMVDEVPPRAMVSGSPGGGVDRVLELMVVVADAELEAAVREAAEEGFEVRLTPVFTPYSG